MHDSVLNSTSLFSGRQFEAKECTRGAGCTKLFRRGFFVAPFVGARSDVACAMQIVRSPVMPGSTQSAQELTRRLFESVVREGTNVTGAANAPRMACERACRDLVRSLGAAGFNALLTRALSQAESEHPLLKGVRVGRGSDLPLLGGIDELVAQHGAPAVDAGLETMLATMLQLLGRLIGDDMVPRLVEHTAPDETHDDQEAK